MFGLRESTIVYLLGHSPEGIFAVIFDWRARCSRSSHVFSLGTAKTTISPDYKYFTF